MKNIHSIPTDKARLYIHQEKLYDHKTTMHIADGTQIPQNIYITSNEEIKEGDWCLDIENEIVKYCEKKYNMLFHNICKKIILTTDQSLDGVQAIDDEFLQWFVQNSSCKEVEVEIETKQLVKPYDVYNEIVSYYKLIIPKEEQKQHLIDMMRGDEELGLYEEPKQETHICKYCKVETTQSDDECYAKPKQETLEEAAKRILANNIDGLQDALQDDDLFFFYKGVIQYFGEAMAKWQSKKMYSEEQVNELIRLLKKTTEYEVLQSFRDKVEQFKKK